MAGGGGREDQRLQDKVTVQTEFKEIAYIVNRLFSKLILKINIF